jgi:hypothetical protein
MTFHLRVMSALDTAQMSGAHLLPIHGALRRAMRQANMSGRAFASAEDLALAVHTLTRAYETPATKLRA